MRRLGWPLFFCVAASAACSEDPPPPPPPPPTQLAIQVVDAATNAPLAGAEVSIDELGEMLTTDASGAILIDPIEAGSYTYRAQKAGYVIFPRPRHDPVSIVVEKEKTSTVTIELEPRPGGPSGTLTGDVKLGGSGAANVLVVATSLRTFATYTDVEGHFRILGIEAPNLYSVTAYKRGHVSTTVNSVDLSVGSEKNVDLTLTANEGAEVGGALIGGTGTSTIVITHRDTGFPVPGLATEVALGGDAWSITGVPPGQYEIRGALEVDGVSFDAEWRLRTGSEGFKLGPELNVTDTSSKTVDLKFAPAIGGISPSGTSSVAGAPTFRWSSVPEANRYVIEIRDVLGTVIYGGFDRFKAPINPLQAPATMLLYSGPQALTPGALYSWRVFALKPVNTGALFEIIGASEEAGGEFRVAP